MKTGTENAKVGEVRIVDGEFKKLTQTKTNRYRWAKCDEHGNCKLGKPKGSGSTSDVDLTSLLTILGGERFAQDLISSMKDKGYSDTLNKSISVGRMWARNRGYVIKATPEESYKTIEVSPSNHSLSRPSPDVEIEGSLEKFD